MESIRQIVNGNDLKPIITLPSSFYDTQVEVIVLPVYDKGGHFTALPALSDPDTPLKPVNHSAFGRLKAYANISLIQEEEGAWEKAAAEKHAIH
ncbi:MAG: hypothetical protein LBU83_03735 [Bacteroidales bacterium]|jgi:hypothetical protein|nr:hypothetical protein [Bacteroidales bacterium]